MLTNEQITEIIAPYTEIDSGSMVSFMPSHLFAACRAIEQAAAREAINTVIDEVKKALIHERSLYLSKWKREAITACVERVDALRHTDTGDAKCD